jgi:hypothetical protein
VLEFNQVAQLTVPLSDGKDRVGSGYLVAERLLLTAAHGVDELTAHAAVDVWFPAVDAKATGGVLWSGSADGLDAALVELVSVPEGPVPLRARAVRWGRLTGQRPAVEATAVGFPRALKEADDERVPEQVDGTLNPGVAFGERYDLNVAGTHPFAKDADPSPWSGLSGAALVCDDLVSGVVVIDTPNYQAGRLTAVPAARLLANADFVAALREHGCSEHWESVELAPLFERSRSERRSPASLLRADNAVVRFRGRERPLADLRSWADGPEDLADDADCLGVMLLVGPGGQGKTRLAQELCQQLRAAGWIAEFVRRNPERARASRLADSRVPVLAVVDYAETRLDDVRELVEASADPSERVRLLLLARSAGEWWQQLRRELRYRAHITPAPIVLEPLEDTPEGRRDAYDDAVTDLAAPVGRLSDRADTDWPVRARALEPPDLSNDAYATILTIHPAGPHRPAQAG